MFQFRFYWIVLAGLLVAGALIIHFVYYSQQKIVIAVVDTGLDLKQLKFRFSTTQGFNVLDPEKSPQDDNGHGTQITSTILFLEPRVKVMPIKAIPKSGVATKQQLAQGIIAAVDRGAKIINISAGVASPSSDLENAVRYAEENEVLVVAAVGSSGNDIEYPAAYPVVVAVGGIDENGTRLPNSNVGPELDVMALGEYTTIGLRGECRTGAGTSLATPLVSIYAARIFLDNPNLKPQEVRDILISSALDIEEDEATGYGVLKYEGVTPKLCEYRTNLSKKEQARIVEEKRKGHEEHLREVEEWKRQGLLEPKKLPPSDLGIKTLDPVLHWSVFRQNNVWQGYLDENSLDSLIIVAAGGSYPAPKQGMVVVLEKSFGGPSKTYPTPTATGPVKIVSEMNGVLTLESLAGEFEVYHEDTDMREKVKTLGGSIYHFDIRTRTFQ
ncbi:MAG: S8 family serine peptidase [Patescibacteria group bacterium]